MEAENIEMDFGIGLTRLSLAYGQTNEIPNEIIKSVGHRILRLDLSHNKFRKIAFLRRFPLLEELILDHNTKLDCLSLPMMRNLRMLWINNCNITNIEDWLLVLQVRCPKLEELSMMFNPVSKTVLNGATEQQERKYRKQVIKMLPGLNRFDDEVVKKFSLLPLIEVVTKKVGISKILPFD